MDTSSQVNLDINIGVHIYTSLAQDWHTHAPGPVFCLLLGVSSDYAQSIAGQAPVPLSIFRSNSKFNENSEGSSFEYTGPITTIFCTRHDSDTVVTCAKHCCDRPRIFYTRVF